MLIKDLYTVLSLQKNGQAINATVQLHKDHEVFKGHFPGSPVMPGVCMIQMIKELTEQFLNKALFLNMATNVKFMAVINPEINPVIEVNIDIVHENDTVKVKNTTTFEDTVALKLNATFKVMNS